MAKSKNTITVNVRQKHIKAGVRCKGGSCPIALALIDVGFVSPEVGPWNIYFHKEGQSSNDGFVPELTAKLPKKATDFIVNFDGEKTVKPFNFVLRFSKKYARERGIA